MPKGTSELSLSIGAPTSPMLSNLLMMEFDRRISRFCARNVAYTRYADDLSFSSVRLNRSIQVERGGPVGAEGSKSPCTRNQSEARQVRVSKRDARRVTGLALTNDQKVSLVRNEKRRIRARMHYFVTGTIGVRTDPSQLRGTLAYVKSVEPRFLKRLRNKYGDNAIQACFKGNLEMKTRDSY